MGNRCTEGVLKLDSEFAFSPDFITPSERRRARESPIMHTAHTRSASNRTSSTHAQCACTRPRCQMPGRPHFKVWTSHSLLIAAAPTPPVEPAAWSFEYLSSYVRNARATSRSCFSCRPRQQPAEAAVHVRATGRSALLVTAILDKRLVMAPSLCNRLRT